MIYLSRDEGHCPHCGKIVRQEDEGEYGIICPICKHDFWFSEVLPEGYEEKGYMLLGA